MSDFKCFAIAFALAGLGTAIRAAHPFVELRVIEHDGHAVVILRYARRSVGRDYGKAGDSAPAVALPHIVDFDCSGGP